MKQNTGLVTSAFESIAVYSMEEKMLAFERERFESTLMLERERLALERSRIEAQERSDIRRQVDMKNIMETFAVMIQQQRKE